jgi:hypothetical protein
MLYGRDSTFTDTALRRKWPFEMHDAIPVVTLVRRELCYQLIKRQNLAPCERLITIVQNLDAIDSPNVLSLGSELC